MIDRNNIPLGATVRWLNHGWAEGIVHEVIKGAAKTMYLVRPGYGLREFGGASYTTGWLQSLPGADILIECEINGKAETLSKPDAAFVYGDAKDYLENPSTFKLPERVPQDKNMYRVWKEQGNAEKVCVETPDEKAERLALQARSSSKAVVRTRSRALPTEEDAPLGEKGVAADVGITAAHFPEGMKHEYDLRPPLAAIRKRTRNGSGN